MQDFDHIHADQSVSGRKVVAAMFALGILATGVLWIYWQFHLMPFMPLQKALSDTFEHSSPRVDGGARKLHKGTTAILRIVMRVPFNPESEEAETESKIRSLLQQTRELAGQHAPLEQYQELEVHLYAERKERSLKQQTFRFDLKDATSEAVRVSKDDIDLAAVSNAAGDTPASPGSDDKNVSAAADNSPAESDTLNESN